MRNIQFGCGNNILEGWENYDSDIDITLPLPFADNSVSRIFIEHCIEHVTAPQMLRFFSEAFRILEDRGVIRVVFPDCLKICEKATPEYINFLLHHGWAKFNNPRLDLESFLVIGLSHGHQQLLTGKVIETSLLATGFNEVEESSLYQSKFKELSGIDSHWKVITKPFYEIESVAFEATKISVT